MRRTLTKQCEACGTPLIIAPRAIGRGYTAVDAAPAPLVADSMVLVGTFAWKVPPLLLAIVDILPLTTHEALDRIRSWDAHNVHSCEANR